MSGSAEITRQSIAAFNVISPVGSEVAEAVQGSYRGEQVMPPMSPDAWKGTFFAPATACFRSAV